MKKNTNRRFSKIAAVACALVVFCAATKDMNQANAGGFSLSINSGHTTVSLGVGNGGGGIYIGSNRAPAPEPIVAAPAPMPAPAPAPFPGRIAPAPAGPRQSALPTANRASGRPDQRANAPIIRGAAPASQPRMNAQPGGPRPGNQPGAGARPGGPRR